MRSDNKMEISNITVIFSKTVRDSILVDESNRCNIGNITSCQRFADCAGLGCSGCQFNALIVSESVKSSWNGRAIAPLYPGPCQWTSRCRFSPPLWTLRTPDWGCWCKKAPVWNLDWILDTAHLLWKYPHHHLYHWNLKHQWEIKKWDRTALYSWQ